MALYQDMYSSVTSQVRLNGHLSRKIREHRGIRQGGETSTEGFKAKDNNFLRKVQKHPTAFNIGCISIGIPTVADDNCLLAKSHTEAQVLLTLAEQNASKDRYIFSTSKSRVVYIPGSDESHNQTLIFNGEPIVFSDIETHLSLARTSSGSNRAAVAERIMSGRRTAYKLMGAGFSGMNGLSPRYTKKLTEVYVTPALMYGLEALRLTDNEIAEIEKYYRGLLRMLQTLPESTGKPSIYLLIGSLPAEALLDRKILTLFGSILHRRGTPEFEVIIRQLLCKSLNSNSWTVKVRLLLDKYMLPNALELASDPPEHTKWKSDVKSAIYKHWDPKLKKEAADMKSLKHLNLRMCSLKTGHPVWDTGTDPMQVPKASVRAHIITGRYSLTGHKCAGRRMVDTCPYCVIGEPETISHFMNRCTLNQDLQQKYKDRLSEYVKSDVNKWPEDELLKVLVDPSHIARTEKDAGQLEAVARSIHFKMHNRRARHDGRGSMFRRAAVTIGRVTTQTCTPQGSPI
jgi:hypothetical protein